MELTDVNLDHKIISLIKEITENQKWQLLKLLESWHRNEQRNDTRIPCLIPVDFATDERVYRDFIQNLSKGGVFIETKEPFTIGQSLSLRFSVPNADNDLTIGGTIIRKEQTGIAVKFVKKIYSDNDDLIRLV